MKSATALVALAAAAGVSGAAVQQRDTTFQLFAYGLGVGGMTVFSDGESVYAGDFESFGDSNAVPVLFTTPDKSSADGTNMTATPLSDADSSPAWSDRFFTVPLAGSSDHAVGLHQSNDTAKYRADRFIMYGAYVFVLESSGSLSDLWYTTPSGVDGIVKLNWNQTDDSTAGQVRVSLRTVAPSTAVPTSSSSS